MHNTYSCNALLSVQLIAGGADSMMVDADGHTPLFKAVLYSQSRAVLSLVLAGVDLNVQDASGSTAVHVSSLSRKHNYNIHN